MYAGGEVKALHARAQRVTFREPVLLIVLRIQQCTWVNVPQHVG
jgi:hypothetical protein